MSDEQRVRTMAGWIGVEISRSRVRTPGKSGYGLYRVRGSVRSEEDPSLPLIRGSHHAGEWTAYAFTLEEIERAVGNAISGGTPAGPAPLGPLLTPVRMLGHEIVPATDIPTRWTAAYRGSRTLGAAVPVELKAEVVQQVAALRAMVDEGLIRMRHDGEWCACDPITGKMTMRCVDLTFADPDTAMLVKPHEGKTTIRERQRAHNAEFQAAHKERRDWGLRQRHARKAAHNARRNNDAG